MLACGHAGKDPTTRRHIGYQVRPERHNHSDRASSCPGLLDNGRLILRTKKVPSAVLPEGGELAFISERGRNCKRCAEHRQPASLASMDTGSRTTAETLFRANSSRRLGKRYILQLANFKPGEMCGRIRSDELRRADSLTR